MRALTNGFSACCEEFVKRVQGRKDGRDRHPELTVGGKDKPPERPARSRLDHTEELLLALKRREPRSGRQPGCDILLRPMPESSQPPIRVLVAKPGLDGHDRGAKVIARALRDAGMEVIYTGLRQTPEMIVNAALQEDVDCVGLSILSGAHNAIVPRVTTLLKERGASDVLVVVGGTIPEQDIEFLKQQGVAAIFGPGTSLDATVTFIREHVKPRDLLV